MRAERLTILVAGDDEVEGKRLSSHLTALNHDVYAADNADEAIRLARVHRLSIVFLDITQTEFDDLALLLKFRNQRIIIILDEARLELASQVLEMGAEDFLLKPFNLALLKARLNVWSEMLGTIQFIGMMVFELKVPLTSIQGYSNLLLSGAVGIFTDQQANFIKTIKTNADRLAKEMRDFLEVARVESKLIYLMPQPTNLEKSINETVKNFHTFLTEKRQVVSLQIPEHLPLAQADDYRLAQVLGILLDNANKYSPEDGHITIPVNEWVENNANSLLVSIQDNGIGIDPDEQGKVFTKWFRSQHDMVLEHRGHGLGLYNQWCKLKSS